MSDNERKGTVAVVTGGARGFGRAFASALAERGAAVALVDIDGEATATTARELGETVIGIAGDVTDEGAMKQVMSEVAERLGGIDLLINNAGLHSHEYSRPVAELGVEKTRRLFEVNVMGTVACTLAAAPHMKGRAGASILNISSSAAYQSGAYGTSKLAVVGLTITFARELAADGIRVNAIAPGMIFTDTIRNELPEETKARVLGMQFIPDEGEERDIVDAMLYLTSPRARFITGETLRVTGGFSAGP